MVLLIKYVRTRSVHNLRFKIAEIGRNFSLCCLKGTVGYKIFFFKLLLTKRTCLFDNVNNVKYIITFLFWLLEANVRKHMYVSISEGCDSYIFRIHQRRRDSELKTGSREVPGSILGRACWPSRSEFPGVFSETHVNTD